MASVIKSQLVKHLSKFTKNLSPDKIQLSTLKGEGELRNLELNETVLTELLELPTWLRLRRAVCNRVSIKVQFSKLKSQPVRLYLDEVLVDMETCEELRQPGNTSGLPSYSSGGRYGFGDRVVDGMYLHINSVVVSFTSHAFKAELQISRIIVQSKTPTWREASDLRYTRISEKHRDLLLTFKEVEWQTIRLEANCMVQDSNGGGGSVSTPLRFIANQAKIRISVKKRYSDCSVVASKVQLLMDDLLWVLTDSQMKAAFVFVKYLKRNIDKAAEQTKQMADKLLQKERQSQSAKPTLASPNTVLFNKFDIQESSLHFQSSRIDFHICDDINSVDPNRKRQVDGGALGITLMKLCVDHYPVRAAGSSRQHWLGYDECMSKRDIWAQNLLVPYGDLLKQIRQQCQQSQQKSTPGGSGLAASAATSAYSDLIERTVVLRLEDFFVTTVSLEKLDEQRPKRLLSSDKKALLLPQDMSTVHFEFTEYFFAKESGLPVPSPNVFIQVNPIVLTVDVMTILWLNSFALSLLHDVEAVVQELVASEQSKRADAGASSAATAIVAAAAPPLVKLEMLMPKIILPALFREPTVAADGVQDASGAQSTTPTTTGEKLSADVTTPTALQIQLSLLTVTNAFCAEPLANACSTGQLLRRDAAGSTLPRPDGAVELASTYAGLYLVTEQRAFPSDVADVPLLRRDVWERITDDARSASTYTVQAAAAKVGEVAAAPGVSRCDSKLWFLAIDQVWLEFTSGPAGSPLGRPASFVESVPLTVWLSVPPSPTQQPSPHRSLSPSKREPHQSKPMPQQQPEHASDATAIQPQRLDVLVKLGAKLCAQLNPAQCGFMLRLADSLKLLALDLTAERNACEALRSAMDGDRAHIVNVQSIGKEQLPPSPLSPPTVVTLLLHVAEIEFAAVVSASESVPAISAPQRQQQQLLPASSATASSACLSNESSSTTAYAVDATSATDGRVSSCSSSPIIGDTVTVHSSLAAGPYSSSVNTPDDWSAHVGIRSEGEAHKVVGADSDSGLFTQSPLSSQDCLSSMGDAAATGRVDVWQKQPSEPASRPASLPGRDGRSLSVVSSTGSLPQFAQAQAKLSGTFAKFTSKVKAAAKSAAGGAADDDNESVISDWDTLSVKSDDEGDFLLLSMDEEVPAFSMVNKAGFIVDDTFPSDVDSISIERQKRLVFVASLKVCNIECGIQIKENNAVVKVAARHIVTADLGCLPYDDFQNRILAAQCILEPLGSQMAEPRTAPAILIRMLDGPGVEHPILGPLLDGFASVVVADYALVVGQSLINKLTAFAAALQHSGLSPKSRPKPLCLEVSNVTTTIKADDTTSSAPSEDTEPVVVHVSKLNVNISPDGTISVHGDTHTRPWPAAMRPHLQRSAMTSSHDQATMTEKPYPASHPSSAVVAASHSSTHDELAADAGPAVHAFDTEDADTAHGGGSSKVGSESAESASQQLLREMGFLRVENETLRERLASQDVELVALRRGVDDGSSAVGAATEKLPSVPSATVAVAYGTSALTTADDGLAAALTQGKSSGSSECVVSSHQLLCDEVERWRQRALECVAEAEDARAERDCLLKTVRLLQDELNESERRACSVRSIPRP